MMNALVVMLLTLYCGCIVDPNGPVQANGGDGFDNNIYNKQNKLDKSGTRIERWKHVKTIELSDGTQMDEQVTYTLHDSKYDWDCIMQIASDMVNRCLPGYMDDGGLSTFSDASCEKFMNIGPFIDVSARYIKDQFGDIHLSQGEILPTPNWYYVIRAGICTRVDMSPFPWPNHALSIGPRIDPKDFVEYSSRSTVDTRM